MEERGNARRGYVPEDEVWFSTGAMEKLRRASRHVAYLMEEGYDKKVASTFVGNHFLLSERQRLAIVRSLATQREREERRQKERPLESLFGEELWMDGFNTIITFEVMLCHSPLFLGMDGAIRDLASLRGTYRILEKTRRAAQVLFSLLGESGVGGVHILLDEPVSNSGRLKTLLFQVGEEYPFSLDIKVLREVDRTLYEKENVVSSDAIILDHCRSWVNVNKMGLEGRGQVLQVWE